MLYFGAFDRLDILKLTLFFRLLLSFWIQKRGPHEVESFARAPCIWVWFEPVIGENVDPNDPTSLYLRDGMCFGRFTSMIPSILSRY